MQQPSRVRDVAANLLFIKAIPIGPRFQAEVSEWKGPPQRKYPHQTLDSSKCLGTVICEKAARLQKDLGSAFQIWKFDEMGEVVAKLWKQSEQQKFACIVKTKAISEGNNFIKLASKSHNTIVNYYFNEYFPRHTSVKTRPGCTLVDTDNEEEENTTPCSKGSRKKARLDGVGPTSKKLKGSYLTGRR
ncbi:hypothetical protein L1987_13856 [Smallanthus sonchifolius]|uniref:Uncharacterized protein n=1 Tax=Smallanthus sonchifolius TaxID=185202 RepID=A0ACB9JJS7_9ASTR|nr:hypothetical protein L1987_13856 [Smallanthus sonchifolius]